MNEFLIVIGSILFLVVAILLVPILMHYMGQYDEWIRSKLK